ncbi:acetyltransferase (GNAT) family protein [Geodermatophilus tzadiensis]|uniref:Acetyltransferase (GNAT) family protein n=1 Tax=Geodermatophilus tzadiensis TaxID=1137988 RepID=A0A2T0TTN3_9ACTN|nr:GNAT family N-acetyltransferase [Geodermatophilus tzadiensis]PRY49011.1 acetyltransferase (GNAT) family protein [Geodermatophilus tzadiensis]
MPSPVDVAALLTTSSTLRRLGAYDITDDPERVDLDVVHAFLSGESYWRRGVSRERVARSVRMSLPLSVHLATATPTMVGFTRVVTDTATHAWLDDLFVLREHRRRGIAGALVEAALSHPAVTDASLQLLLTADAHALYARHGFRPFPEPGALMARHPQASPVS